MCKTGDDISARGPLRTLEVKGTRLLRLRADPELFYAAGGQVIQSL
jgi:hypothetical protein